MKIHFKLPLFFLTFLLVLPCMSYAQSKSVKIYGNFLFANSHQHPRESDYEPAFINYNGLTFAYNVEKSNATFQQIEARINIEKIQDGGIEVNRSAFHLRYEYGKILAKSRSEKLNFSIAGAAKLFYQNQDFEDPLSFPRRDLDIGLTITAFATVQFNFSERLFLEFGLSPFGLTNSYIRSVNNNPAFPARQQIRSNFNFDAFNERHIRIGAGYRFVKKAQK